ncbi:GcrA family cell cycle regulator [Aliihoeflea sp. PC F10.4]
MPASAQIVWTDAEIERTVHLWNVDGLTCSQIAKKLCDEFGSGRSRCAVAGLVNRKSLLFQKRQGNDGRPIGHVYKVAQPRKRTVSEKLLPHEIKFAADMWNRGHTATRIAEVIGDKFAKHVTRFSIATLVRDRPDVFRQRVKGELQRGRATAPSIVANLSRPDAYQPTVTKDAARAYDAASRRLPLPNLDWSDCRFPVNEAERGETHLFCGKPVVGGKVLYCAHHAARCVGSGTEGERSAARVLRNEAKRAA